MDRKTGLLLGCAVAMVAFFGIFELPFFFPTSHPSSSQSFVAGFDNRVSVLITLLASLSIFLIAYFCRVAPSSGLLQEHDKSSRLSIRIFAIAAAGYVLAPGTMAVAACHSPRYFMADARYFLSALNQVAFHHRRPYVDFEFLYGPLLLYPTVWLHDLVGPFGFSLEACYYATTIGMSILGLYLLFWIINELYPVTPYNALLFGVIALVTMPLRLGANYTFFRGLAALAAVLYLRRVEAFASRWNTARKLLGISIYLVACALATTLISLEAGVSFLAGALAYTVFRAARDRSFAVVTAAPVLGTLAAIPLFGGGFLQSLRLFSGGYMNWVVVPYPLLVLYLCAVIAPVPIGIAAILRRKRWDAPVITAACICSLSLVPVALGRCDFGHIVFAGTGIFILGFAHLSTRLRRFQATGVYLLCSLLLLFFTTRLFMHRHQFASILREGLIAVDSSNFVAQRVERIALPRIHPVQALPPFIGNEKIATPWELDKDTDKLLMLKGVATPEFYTDFLDVATPEAEALKIVSLSRENWALAPHDPDVYVWDRKFVREYFLFPVTYRERNKSYPAATPTLNYLRANFHVVSKLGDYDLYQRN